MKKEINENGIKVARSSMPPYEEYIEAIRPLWESHWLTNMGQYHRQLEQKLKEYLGVKELSLTVNGHMALELAIQAYDFPEGSEIITTPFTFISTTHAIVRNGLKPVFCDIKPDDGTMAESKIEDLITGNTVAILPVHVFGNICNVEGIQKIADKYNLKVIYDAAHAFGIKYKGQGIGSYGDASVFSFHATKVFNTIEGGAVAFSDDRMYEKLYNLKNFGIRGEELVGANAKMNEFAAIMGLCNLKRMGKVIQTRRTCYSYYMSRLREIKGIRLFEIPDNVEFNYGYMPIVIEDEHLISRDMLYDKMKENNIHCRKYFYPITADQECFKGKYRNVPLDSARHLAERILCLPLYEELTKEEMDKVISVLEGKAGILRGGENEH